MPFEERKAVEDYADRAMTDRRLSSYPRPWKVHRPGKSNTYRHIRDRDDRLVIILSDNPNVQDIAQAICDAVNSTN